MQTIVVLLKQTFDTEEKITVTPQGVEERDAKLVINPYDEYALEEALRLKERVGGNVVVVTCGPERAQESLRTALAVGADEAIRIDSAGLEADSHLLSAALAAVIAPLAPDLLLAGLFAVDSGSGSVALQVAERLGLPHASAAVKLAVGSAAELGVDPIGGAAAYALVERDVEGDTETVALPLPALITAQQGLNEPRYPSLPGIMKAKRKPLRIVALDEIGLNEDDAIASIRTRRTHLYPPPPRAAGKRIGGSAAEQAFGLVKLLQDEAKVL
ncbi:electron transfer flavoprotein subunit beta/FixA family protein [Paenibacillus sp. LHD-117]|uniref:electron transfer flavoprotein subunit beta/FixA family protein n=1 Tax=Paenibacillus sp. LHD-117 TaxID=3071412 RepID=UPI0027E01EA6|nr:electron transfer flavoprotein subunit beta/FixA family protein [Paenibacillus sp. LHD-117]MDQ6421314.1 electron transfer flavoprotein subunit beta/FixA family protein [Paenibacillus sp. LHD-117]